jgi:hypothetical protein
MPIELKLHVSHINDFAATVLVGPSVFEKLVEGVEAIPSPTLTSKELLDKIEEIERTQAKGEVSYARKIVTQAVSLAGFTARNKEPIEEAIDALNNCIHETAKWSEDRLGRWQQILPLFERLVRSKAIEMISKVIDLSYEYSNLYRSGRIITDLRPVFSDTENGLEVDAGVVSFSLRLRYDSSDGEKELTIAMDSRDIVQLATQCKRAIDKAILIREKVTSVFNVAISGGELPND